MMKIVIAGVAAFVLALGGGTGVTMWRAKQAAAVHGAAAGEKATTATATASDSGHAVAAAAAGQPDGAHAKADSVPAVAAAGTPPAHAGAAADSANAESLKAAALKPRGPVANVRPAAAPAVPKGTPDSVQRALGFKQLAKIFASMKPTDATKVMALMTDDEVEGVLRQFQPRQAADLLANFPKERAAALSRRLLQPRGA